VVTTSSDSRSAGEIEDQAHTARLLEPRTLPPTVRMYGACLFCASVIQITIRADFCLSHTISNRETGSVISASHIKAQVYGCQYLFFPPEVCPRGGAQGRRIGLRWKEFRRQRLRKKSGCLPINKGV
jgi:hypothetical protein